MRFYEFKKDGSTLAVRTINRYADEVGPDSMDYDMFKKSAELLDKQMLKSLAQHIENSDTAPREVITIGTLCLIQICKSGITLGFVG